MASRFSICSMTLAARSATASTTRGFHSTRSVLIKVGDSVPKVLGLTEGSPANKVNLAEELSSGKGLIIGVPGAFTPGCSQNHIPGYLAHPHLKQAGKVFVVSVNDPYVMKAWGNVLDPTGSKGVRFIADASADFTKALNLDFDATPILGNHRSKRYAIVVEDGKVKSTHIEPDGTGINESMADKVLGPPPSLY